MGKVSGTLHRLINYSTQNSQEEKNLWKTKIDLVRPTDIQHTQTYPNSLFGKKYRIHISDILRRAVSLGV